MSKKKRAYKKVLNDFKEYIFKKEYFNKIVHSNNSKIINFYVDLRWSLDNNHYDLFDDNGIPLRRYLNHGTQYNHTRIAAYAIANWQRFIDTGEEEYKNIFFNQVNWIINNVSKVNGSNIWYYNFDFGEIKAPWTSAMSHGEFISILTRAYLITGDNKYKNIIEGAMPIYKMEISQGGIQSSFPDGGICFEEYAIKSAQHVLNGHLYALFGLADYCLYINPNDEKYRKLFDEAIDSLKNNLRNYDNYFWSLYHFPLEKFTNPTTCYYHQLHIAQLEGLYYITQDNTFKIYADRWKKFSENLFNRIWAMVLKIIYRVNYPSPR